MPLTIAGVCIAAYYPVLSVGFLADDFAILHAINNFTITDVGSEGIFFRPVAWLSFALDYHIFEEWAVGFHLVNLLLHIVASLGVAACARILTRNPFSGLVAGLVFALHPAHPEAVSWIAGRFDMLCGALLVWSLYFHLRWSGTDAGSRRPMRVLSLILFVLACLTKEMAFAFPMAIFICGFFPKNNADMNKPLRVKILHAAPFFIAGALMFALRWEKLGGIGGTKHVPDEVIELFSSKVLYQIFLQPFVILSLPMNHSILAPAGIWAGLMKVVLLSPLVLLINSNRRAAVYCAAAIICSNLPASYMGVLEGCLRNSRFLYIPSFFFAILIAVIFSGDGMRGWLKRGAAILMVIYMATLFLCLHCNNQPWRVAGELAQNATASAEKLIDRHKGEWGVIHRELLAFNVPRTFLGALVFDWGFPEMLRHCYGDELMGVEIEVIHGGTQTKENMHKLEIALQESAVVWLFDDRKWAFIEYRPNKRRMSAG